MHAMLITCNNLLLNDLAEIELVLSLASMVVAYRVDFLGPNVEDSKKAQGTITYRSQSSLQPHACDLVGSRHLTAPACRTCSCKNWQCWSCSF